MDTLFIILFFGFLPALSIGLCFLQDSNSRRRLVLNILLLANAALFLLPPGMAWYINMTEGGGYGENAGGAAFWLYFYILPFTVVVELILFLLKLHYRRQSLKEEAAASAQ